MNSGIYKITCLANGTYYIGRTCNFLGRRGCHLSDLRRGSHKNQRLQHSFDKYGEENFQFELIEPIDDIQSQIKREQELLDANIGDPLCLNINKSAETRCDVPWTEERKRKISESHKGKKMPPMREEVKKARSDRMKGHTLPKEVREKISQKAVGRKKSKETLRRLSLRFSGEGNPMFGRKGETNPQSVPVLQVDKDTLCVLNVFPSSVQAAEAVGGVPDTIRKASKKGNTSCYGYLWFRDGEYTMEKARKLMDRIENRHPKGTQQKSSKAVVRIAPNGDRKEYDFLSAAKDDGFDPSTIVKVCKGKLSMHKGFRWEYKEAQETIESTAEAGSE